MLPLGTEAPDFELTDVVSGEMISLSDFVEKKALLVIFLCRHCPYVQHVQNEIAKIGQDYENRSLGIVAISANDPNAYPEDAPESLKEMAEELGFNFPFCYDESQETAKAYTAACTPDFFLFDTDRKLVYRGQLDDARPKNDTAVTGKDLRGAIESVLNGSEVSADQKPSMGCSIKWKVGNEPDYQKG
jgi:peroxiredoxin